MSFRPDQVGLRIGISPWAASRSGVERVAEAAMDVGIDTFWLGDGLLGRPDFPAWSGGLESFGELAWLAGRYPGASVALGAAVLPLRDPLWVAKSAATLDQLTQGRFTLVLTPGNWPEEFAAMGRDFGGRGTAPESGLCSLREICRPGRGDGGLSPRPWESRRASHLPLAARAHDARGDPPGPAVPGVPHRAFGAGPDCQGMWFDRAYQAGGPGPDGSRGRRIAATDRH